MTLGNVEERANVGPRWFVVFTQPRAESRAVFHLQRQGYAVFCPRVRKRVRHARKTGTSLVSLFPNYLFVRLDMSRDLWRSINGTMGVIRLVMSGEAPQPAPEGVVELLQEKFGPDGVAEGTVQLKQGQAVKITEGPFADLIGRLERLGPENRVVVLLNLLGRAVSVALQAEVLEAAA
jgi:transcriptional antiterminator RfaH